MGACEGRRVGEGEGAGVGSFEGSDVGAFEGAGVGSGEGAGVGAGEGADVVGAGVGGKEQQSTQVLLLTNILQQLPATSTLCGLWCGHVFFQHCDFSHWSQAPAPGTSPAASTATSIMSSTRTPTCQRESKADCTRLDASETTRRSASVLRTRTWNWKQWKVSRSEGVIAEQLLFFRLIKPAGSDGSGWFC